jgi:hypothetical protein
MTPDEQEQMNILCQRIALEQDQERFTELIQQLNELLDGKSNRLSRNPPAKSTQP